MIEDVKHDAERRMQRAIETLEHELSGIRTGRASPALVERLHVDYYGASTPLNQIAGISVPEARLLIIQPWDRGAIGAIERAILKSELGLTPNSDGTVIRLSIPPLTEERRKALVRLVHQKVEEGKVAVRNIRRDAVEQIKEAYKEKLIGEDDERRALHDIDVLTKQYVDAAETAGQIKEAEVLEV